MQLKHNFFKEQSYVNISYLLQQHTKLGQVENADFSDIADFISPTFINPCFRYSPVVNVENLDLKKSKIFKHPCFRYSPMW